ncbi:MAG: hypothetical protein KKH93_04045 [Candidatus Omnitrophica bacterium]|nr:hypothetical protein [Candidatus Omnitrophota bacterium]
MQRSNQRPLLKRILSVSAGLFLLVTSADAQSLNSKVTNFILNNKQPVTPGNLIASCIVQEGGDIPYKRYALVYLDYDSSNNIKMVLEKTAVQWGGWGWVEISWFSPLIEKKSCRLFNLSGSECTVAMAGEVAIKLKLIDGLGGLSAEKEMIK